MVAAARRRHALGFEPVALDVPALSYEPRSSCQCTQCAAVWVGSKSGVVMHLALAPSSSGASQRWLRGTREARAVHHLHGGLAPGDDHLLLVGRDDGSLEIVPDGHVGWTEPTEQATWRLHLDTWCAKRAMLAVRAPGECVEGPADAPDRFAAGITAIAAIARPDEPHAFDLLVATRYPCLYVIEARDGVLRFAHRMALPGWIDWIFPPSTPDGAVRLLSRGGHLLSFKRPDLARGAPPRCRELPVQPTAALVLDGATPAPGRAPDLAIGTTTGLVIVRDAPDDELELHAVRSTRTGVLSLGTTAVADADGVHHYLTLGLEDGRLSVIDVDLLRPGQAVTARPTTSAKVTRFSIKLGAPVLAVQTLRPAGGPDEQVYVLAVLRDHQVRLFTVTSEETQRAEVGAAWEALRATQAPQPGDRASIQAELALVSPGRLLDDPSDAPAWAYAMADVVLPALHARVKDLPGPDGVELRTAIVDATCAVLRRAPSKAAGGKDRALHRLATSVRDLVGDDVDLVLQLSEAVVSVAVTDEHGATSLIEDHLQALAAVASTCAATKRPKLVAWMRFVRKYILRGHAFAAKRLNLSELVEQNYRAHKHIDALIYQVRLHQRGYDLRWEHGAGEEIAAVHVATWPAPDGDPTASPASVVVAITSSARLVLLDGTTGESIPVVREQTGGASLFASEEGPMRVLASAVVVDGGVLRVIVSGDGSRLPSPGLAMVELRRDANPRVPTVVADPTQYPQCRERVRVHAITALPGHPDTLVLGLNSGTYRIGRLQCRRSSVLELAGSTQDHPVPTHEARHAPGTVPTRALAVLATGDASDRYLAVAGSDDGRVLVWELDGQADAASWKPALWSLVEQPIACAALGYHAASHRMSCYLGTTTGEVFALTVDPPRAEGSAPPARDGQPFGPYVARSLWRDSHRARVIATRMWATPIFRDAQIMVTATANGRLCVYRHDDEATKQQSSRGNYYFRGTRYDRITLPDGLQAFSLVDGSHDVVASRPGGVIYLARLAYLRESVHRGSPGAAPSAGPELPPDSWGRLDRLLRESEIAEPFASSATEKRRRTLALCELIQLDDGVVANYARRERRAELERWTTMTAVELAAAVRAELHGLRADRPVERARLRLIFKSVCGAFLSVRPDKLRDELLAEPVVPDAQAGAIATVCKLLCTEILSYLSHADDPRSHLAIVGMKELMRVPVLRAIGGDAEHHRVARDAIEEVLTTCLRHDLRLVRTEALRAVSVMLRNLGVMVKTLAPASRARVLNALVPKGIRSVNWLIDPLIHDLSYFRGFKAGSVLVSGAWYRASALAQLFWVFPDRALALCDHLVARGLPVDVLGLCVQVMRGQQVQRARQRIERFFFAAALGREVTRAEFIATYRCEVAPVPSATAVDPEDDVAEIYLSQLYDQLARMWAVDRLEDLPALAERTPALAAIPRDARRTHGVLVTALDELAQIALDLSTPSYRVRALQRLGELDNPACAQRQALHAPLQHVLSQIIGHWLAFPHPPDTGMKLGAWVLGPRLTERHRHHVFAITEHHGQPGVMIVFQGASRSEREAFVEAARFVYERPAPSLIRVELVDTEGAYPAYRSPSRALDLETYLTDNRDHAALWATDAVEQVGSALQHIHQHGRSHGDVHPHNIHVAIDPKTLRPSFTLGGLDYATIHGSPDPEHTIPVVLSQKCRSSVISTQRWNDVVALALIAYRMLVKETFSPTASSLRPQHLRLRHARSLGRAIDQPLFGVLFDILDLELPILSIDELLVRLQGKRRRRPSGPISPSKLNVVFTSAAPNDKLPLMWLDKELAGVRAALASHPGVQLRIKGAAGDKPSGRLTVMELARQIGSGADVIHFGGHGSAAGIHVWEHDGDGSRIVTGDALQACFRDRQITLVVLNACYSQVQADAIAKVVDAVVGTRDHVSDEAACVFAVTFYRELAAGKTINDAFETARNAVGLASLDDVFFAKGALDLVLCPR